MRRFRPRIAGGQKGLVVWSAPKLGLGGGAAPLPWRRMGGIGMWGPTPNTLKEDGRASACMCTSACAVSGLGFGSRDNAQCDVDPSCAGQPGIQFGGIYGLRSHYRYCDIDRQGFDNVEDVYNGLLRRYQNLTFKANPELKGQIHLSVSSVNDAKALATQARAQLGHVTVVPKEVAQRVMREHNQWVQLEAAVHRQVTGAPQPSTADLIAFVPQQPVMQPALQPLTIPPSTPLSAVVAAPPSPQPLSPAPTFTPQPLSPVPTFTPTYSQPLPPQTTFSPILPPQQQQSGQQQYDTSSWFRSEPMQFGQPQFGQPQFGQPQFGQPQFEQPQFGQTQFGQTQFGQPQFGQTQFGRTQFGQPEFGQPQFFGQTQFGQTQFGQPQFEQTLPQTYGQTYGQSYGQTYAQPYGQSYGQTPYDQLSGFESYLPQTYQPQAWQVPTHGFGHNMPNYSNYGQYSYF